MYFATQAGTK